MVAEGAGQELFAYDGAVDASGNARLADIGAAAAGADRWPTSRRPGPSSALRYVDPGYAIRSVPANG